MGTFNAAQDTFTVTLLLDIWRLPINIHLVVIVYCIYKFAIVLTIFRLVLRLIFLLNKS